MTTPICVDKDSGVDGKLTVSKQWNQPARKLTPPEATPEEEPFLAAWPGLWASAFGVPAVMCFLHP